MIIKDIQTIEIRIPYTVLGTAKTDAWGGKHWSTADALLVRIETANGIIGWGEAFGYNSIAATKTCIESLIKPLCIDQNIHNIQEFTNILQKKLHIFGRGGPVIFGLSGIDIALWDIWAQENQSSVAQLLGGSNFQEIDAYASLVRYEDPKTVSDNVKHCVDLGFKYVKLHEIDLRAITAARRADPNVHLMLDVNCPWNTDEAIEMARNFQELDITWLEEPVWPPEDHLALAKIRKEGGIPLAAGENAATLKQYETLMESGSIDFIQPSPTKTGGISTTSEVFKLAKKYNVRVVPHSFYEGPGLLAAIQTSAALSDKPLVEWRFFDCEDHLYGEEIVPKNGKMLVPDGIGLGLSPIEEVISKYKV